MVVTLAQEEEEPKTKEKEPKTKDKKEKKEKKKAGDGEGAEASQPAKAGKGKQEQEPANTQPDAPGERKGRKRARAVEVTDVKVGSLLPALVSQVRPDELVLSVNVTKDGSKAAGGRVVAKVFVTHSDKLAPSTDLSTASGLKAEEGEGELPASHPLAGYSVGQEVEARVLDVRDRELSQIKLVECSLRPRDLAAADVEALEALQPTWEHLAVGGLHAGVVTEVQEEGLWVALSRAVKGFVHYLDVSHDPSAFAHVVSVRAVGTAVMVLITGVDAARHRLQLSIKAVPEGTDPASLPTSLEGSTLEQITQSLLPQVGQVLTGRVCIGDSAPQLFPPSVAVQLGHRLFARVCITEVDDPEDWTDQPIPKPDASVPSGKAVVSAEEEGLEIWSLLNGIVGFEQVRGCRTARTCSAGCWPWRADVWTCPCDPAGWRRARRDRRRPSPRTRCRRRGRSSRATSSPPA